MPNADAASPTLPSLGELPNLNPGDDLLDLPDSPEVLEIDGVIPLTLEQAIGLAETNNRSLQIARTGLQRDQALLDQARAQLYPTLSLQGQVNRQLDPSTEISTNATRNQLSSQIAETEAAINTIENILPNVTDPVDEIVLALRLSDLQRSLQSNQTTLRQLDSYPTTVISGSVQVDYALYSPQRTAGIQQAEAQAEFTELEVNRLQEEIRLEVTNAYYDLQDAEAQAEIFRADIERRSRNLRDIEALLGAGLATRLDLLNAQVELDASQQNLLNAESQVRSAQSALVQILSVPAGFTVTAAEPVATVAPWRLSLEETIFLALQNRVELDQQLARREVAEAQRNAALAGRRPQVNLFATYDVLELSSDDPRASAVEGFGDGYSLGLTVNWLLLDGGATNAGARAAAANIEAAELRFSETSNQIRSEITQAYASLLANTENLATAQNAVRRAEEALRIARLRFQAGVGTQSDVLDADFRLTEALGNVKTATLGYNRSVAALQRFIGISADQPEPELE
ncbi:TolC family protein [Oscillatoria sp. CS-180]|uniref:TolC family protein n=1 Tax=Oscillatoria sp. CS-180 TaxID=3021720 RepID=UPI00232CBA81|nr:TolC family protein [Oscillatoria sp. CS-180]MDB9529657.1 TolC family protein [Oscillatoria sp. CS-180]